MEQRLALICGTSTCHTASSIAPCFVPGVWGPYFGAMFEGLYLNEGGQSAAGAALDHLIWGHKASADLRQAAQTAGQSPTDFLNHHLAKLAGEKGVSMMELTADFHVVPDFNGN